MNLKGNCVDGIWWKLGYTCSVTFLTNTASHFYQIIVHYMTVLAIMSPSTQLSWFSKLRPLDLDYAICSICRFWGANWANFRWYKFHVDWTTRKRVLKSGALKLQTCILMKKGSIHIIMKIIHIVLSYSHYVITDQLRKNSRPFHHMAPCLVILHGHTPIG